ncbi:3-methyl-2-oxobutanoate dehydrogenase (2-methylpropanoyl-transferring) subunit alpha, partial [Pseudomonadota bacterium]
MNRIGTPHLHIPQPSARPGDTPDFSYLDLSEAGEINRPPIDASAASI